VEVVVTRTWCVYFFIIPFLFCFLHWPTDRWNPLLLDFLLLSRLFPSFFKPS